MKKYSSPIIYAVMTAVLLAGCGKAAGETTVLETEASAATSAVVEMTAASSDETNAVETVVTDPSESAAAVDYSVASDKSAEEIEGFMMQVKDWIINGDVDSIVDHMGDSIYIQGVEYTDPEAVRSLLSGEESPISNSEYVDSLRDLTSNDMFANSYGISIGDGQIWIQDTYTNGSDNCTLVISTIN